MSFFIYDFRFRPTFSGTRLKRKTRDWFSIKYGQLFLVCLFVSCRLIDGKKAGVFSGCEGLMGALMTRAFTDWVCSTNGAPLRALRRMCIENWYSRQQVSVPFCLSVRLLMFRHSVMQSDTQLEADPGSHISASPVW